VSLGIQFHLILSIKENIIKILSERAPNLPSMRRVMLPKSKVTNKVFIYFDDHNSAVEAVRILNNLRIDEETCLAVDLAIPLRDFNKKTGDRKTWCEAVKSFNY